MRFGTEPSRFCCSSDYKSVVCPRDCRGLPGKWSFAPAFGAKLHKKNSFSPSRFSGRGRGMGYRLKQPPRWSKNGLCTACLCTGAGLTRPCHVFYFTAKYFAANWSMKPSDFNCLIMSLTAAVSSLSPLVSTMFIGPPDPAAPCQAIFKPPICLERA